MANLPESPQWESGIYQLETTDPVLGGTDGISNAQAKGLANRTSWLKQAIQNILNALGDLATINSPLFTGTPAAPTGPVGDNSTQLATSAWVNRASSGVLSKDISSVAAGGTVTLAETECGYGVLYFYGSGSGTVTVVFPATRSRLVVIGNGTASRTLSVKTPSGTAVTVAPSKTRFVWCDGTNFGVAHNDLTDADLLGVPTAPTAAAGDSSKQVSNTEFVRNSILKGFVLNEAVYTASGTFVVPAGVTMLEQVEVIGGGGGGGGRVVASTTNGGGGGGGGGGYARGPVSGLLPGQVITVTVGAGGSGSAGGSGGDGGTSSFGGAIQATGGKGGGGGSSAWNGGAPGVGAGGTYNIYGCWGTDSAPSFPIPGNGGAAGGLGGGGGRGGCPHGADGSAPGAGGGGGYGYDAVLAPVGTTLVGGNGNVGAVIVRWRSPL